MTRPTLILLSLALGGCLDPHEPGNLVPKTVVEDPTLPRIEVAGALLHAEAFGDPNAPAIIVLHGGPGGDYRSVLPLKALADDGYRVVFWDQRGTGLSQRFDGGVYSYALYLEDLRLVIEKMVAPGRPFTFIGHSWGAMYATWFINEHGDYGGRVRGAVLCEPGAFTKGELDDFIKQLMGSIALTGEQFNDALWLTQFISASDHATADYMRGMLALEGLPSEHRDPANLPPIWRAGAVVNSALLKLTDEQGFDWTTRLSAFRPKVLFLRGDLNDVATLEHQQKLAAHYPSAEVITIANAGHEVVWSQPAAFLAHTRSYFQSIGFLGGAP